MPPDDFADAVGVIGAVGAIEALRRRLAAAGLRVHAVGFPEGERAHGLVDAVRSRCDVIVTLLPTQQALHSVLRRDIAADRAPLTVLDLSPITPLALRELAASSRGVMLFGASIVSARRDGAVRTVLHVDSAALGVERLQRVLAALADDVIGTGEPGRAKAVALLDDLLAGVNAAVIEEALALGRRAGLKDDALDALIQKGSGATTLLASRMNGDPLRAAARREALARVAAAAQEIDHSLFFGSLAIAALLAKSSARSTP